MKIQRSLRWTIKWSLVESFRVNMEESIRNGYVEVIVIDISKHGGESR